MESLKNQNKKLALTYLSVEKYGWATQENLFALTI